ncbi:MAG: hypothetical protein R2838_09220 [Caldilineaceae bacterium]
MATAETTVAAPKKSVMRSGAAQKLLAFGALIIIFAFFAIASPVFFTWENIKGIFLATAVNGILALGVTFVIITAGIDLSVGTVMTLSAVMTGVFITFWSAVPVGILATWPPAPLPVSSTVSSSRACASRPSSPLWA